MKKKARRHEGTEARREEGSILTLRAFVPPCLRASLLFSFLLASCADDNKAPTTKPETVEQRQQDALQDPFGYGPKTDPDYLAKHGLDADGKPTLKSDVDKFLNP